MAKSVELCEFGAGQKLHQQTVSWLFLHPIFPTEPAMTDISLQANNPLLDFSGLPRFADIRPEHITPAIDVLLERAAAAVAKVKDLATPVSWNTVVTALEDATEPLGRAWGVVGHLSAVVDTPALREAHAATKEGRTAILNVGAHVAAQRVIARATIEVVRSGGPRDQVIARARTEIIGARRACQRIRTRSADD